MKVVVARGQDSTELNGRQSTEMNVVAAAAVLDDFAPKGPTVVEAAVAAAVRTIGAIEAVGARSLLQLPKDCCYVDVAPDLLQPEHG